MIVAALTRFENGFLYTVSGHSGYAEYGKDVICSAISMLTLTIAERLKERDDIESAITVKRGSAHIEAVGNVSEIYEVLRCGLKLLSEDADIPENCLKIGLNDRISKV